jgi:hypothetical protein
MEWPICKDPEQIYLSKDLEQSKKSEKFIRCLPLSALTFFYIEEAAITMGRPACGGLQGSPMSGGGNPGNPGFRAVIFYCI